jgi:C4-dicarboxylate-specific signal transduction histidine kinase
MVLAALLVLPLGSTLPEKAFADTPGVSAAPVPGTNESGGTRTGMEGLREERIAEIEKTLQSIKATSEKAEERGYYNKMLGRELIGYVKVVVIILAIIAVVFPLAIWLMSRKRLLGLSGLSSEVAATLLVVEERQAKLTNILKEIQGEIDYLHTMSVPDLKNLIQQAENYLKQNESDLEKAGAVRKKKPDTK